jgi:hypothetical protein
MDCKAVIAVWIHVHAIDVIFFALAEVLGELEGNANMK